MERLINKDRVLAEIENRIKKYTLLQQKPEMSDLQEELQNKIDCLNSIKGYILDTLEVKEVDLDNELDFVKDAYYYFTSDERNSIKKVAKHFFELGLSASNQITAADRGIADEIIFALKAFGEEKMISYDKEIEWLRNKVKKGE